MNQKQRAKWERTRAKGMWRFILLCTVLFGGALLISTSIFDYFTSFNGFRLQDLYFKLPIYLVGGLVFGVLVWFVGEYKYKKYSNNTSLN
jgi:hypothetical protein